MRPTTDRRPLTTIVSLAWRESRKTRHRLLLASSSITLGVAALVAIDSFAANVTRSVREQSRHLLGGDIAVGSRRPFTVAVNRTLDSLRGAGYGVARETAFPAMAVLRRSDATRLVQVRAVSPGYPLYGRIGTDPPGRWMSTATQPAAFVDPALLVALDARIGDTISIGYARFVIAGAVRDAPGMPDIAQMLGPRVFIADRYIPETQLLVLGSTASYDAYIRTNGRGTAALARTLRERFRRSGDVRIQTIDRAEQGLTEAVGQLRQFVGVVGMVALLLGGLGVASGVHAFVARKIDTVAILRCLGATSRQVLAMYVAQAAVMGLAGAAIGAAIGVFVQTMLPRLVADLLPIDVAVRAEPSAIALGLAVGAWVALVFALGPLLSLRRVSPLQTLRRDFERPFGAGRDWARHVVAVAIVVSVLAIAFTRASTPRMAAGIALGTTAALVTLVASGALLIALARRMARARWPYVVRQGVSNLHRPGNQTRPVVLALGFGAFLVTTLQLVQTNLLRRFEFAAATTGANVVFFDVQEDQVAGVHDAARAGGERVLQTVPIVTMRIAAVRGERVSDLLADTTRRSGRPLPWTLRWEYRSTYRDTLTSSESLRSGKWFAGRARGNTVGVSLESDIAGDLRVKVGDVIAWNVHGTELHSRVESIREVKWARFEPNFFAVFQPGALDAAPKQFVVVGRTSNSAATARLQRDIVRRYPNVSSIDLSVIRRTVDTIVGRVTAAIRFLAILSLAMAVPVILSAVAATRRERLRESVLLKTLGATRNTIVRILASEYFALGALGSLTGVLLAVAAAFGLVRFVFEMPFAVDVPPLLAISAAVVVLTIGIGILGAREVYRRTPMEALRDV